MRERGRLGFFGVVDDHGLIVTDVGIASIIPLLVFAIWTWDAPLVIVTPGPTDVRRWTRLLGGAAGSRMQSACRTKKPPRGGS
jgi:hypothetical protein